MRKYCTVVVLFVCGDDFYNGWEVCMVCAAVRCGRGGLGAFGWCEITCLKRSSQKEVIGAGDLFRLYGVYYGDNAGSRQLSVNPS